MGSAEIFGKNGHTSGVNNSKAVRLRKKLAKNPPLDVLSTGENELDRPKTYPLHCSVHLRVLKIDPFLLFWGKWPL